MNKKNPLFTSCDHKEDCTCDNVFNELTPINPAQARQKLDCIARMREALKKADHFIGNLDPEQGNYTYYALADVLMSIEQALQETQRKG